MHQLIDVKRCFSVSLHIYHVISLTRPLECKMSLTSLLQYMRHLRLLSVSSSISVRFISMSVKWTSNTSQYSKAAQLSELSQNHWICFIFFFLLAKAVHVVCLKKNKIKKRENKNELLTVRWEDAHCTLICSVNWKLQQQKASGLCLDWKTS